MKQTGFLIFIALIFSFMAVVPGYSADVAKIGVIDFQKILTESSAGKQAQKEISEKGAELKAKLEEMKNEVEEMNLTLERESLVMSNDKKAEKRREMRIKINDFKQKQVEFENEFKAMESRIVMSIQKDVRAIAQEMGTEQGFLLILMKEAAGIVYSPDHVNITDQVIEKYNKKLAEKK